MRLKMLIFFFPDRMLFKQGLIHEEASSQKTRREGFFMGQSKKRGLEDTGKSHSFNDTTPLIDLCE